MRQQLVTMLQMQDSMNTKVHPRWVGQKFEWYRAVWVECAELMDHHGYKWWKKQTADLEQVELEIIDIWHFGLSCLLTQNSDVDSLADEIERAIVGFRSEELSILHATERLAQSCLATQEFSVDDFWQLMAAAEIDFQRLYIAYVGKNVLNFFRQDHGYKSGTYTKEWQGREDNEHLVELAAALDSSSVSFRDDLYAALTSRYELIQSVAEA